MALRNLIKGPLHVAILGASLFALSIIVWAWIYLLTQEDPFWDIAWIGDGIVASLEDDGPFAIAGVEAYDLLLSIDGQAPGPMPVLHPDRRAGDPVRVRFFPSRQNPDTGPVEVELVLASMPVERQFAQGTKLILAMIALLMGTLVGVWRPNRNLARVVYALMLVAAFTYASNVLRLATPNGLRVARILELWTVGLLFHACFSFAHAASPKVHNWTVRILYTLLGLLSLLLVVVLPLLNAIWNEPSLWVLGNRILFAAISFFMFAALVVLFFSKARTALRERRRRIVVGGITMGLLPMLTLSVLPVFLRADPLLEYAYTNPFLALIPLAFSYALYHGTQARLDRAVHNSSVYTLFVVLALAVAAPVLYALHETLSASSWSFALIGSALIVFFGTIFGRARLFLEHGLDRLIYGGWHRYREIVRQVSAELDHADDTGRPVNLLLDMARTMRLKPAILYSRDGERLVPDASVHSNYARRAASSLPIYGHLAEYFRETAYPTWHHQLRNAISDDDLLDSERTLFEQSTVQLKRIQLQRPRGRRSSDGEQSLLWVPLVSGAHLLGLLALETRDPHHALFSEDDLDTLATLSGQVALAIENTALNESLATRLREVEEIRDDLAEAQRRLTHEREDERLHLARELHDGPLQMMFGIRYQLDELQNALHDALNESDDLRHRCNRAKATLQEVARTLRGICNDLRPPVLSEFGLKEALHALADQLRARYPDVALHLHVMPEGKRLPEITRLALYRICQEAINNAARHGQARTITVHFEYDAEEILLEIEDDGRGFNVPDRWTTLAQDGHLGVIGMQERAGSIGGTFSLDSEPGSGTRVRVSIPPNLLLDSALPDPSADIPSMP